jgi:chromosome segregation ATPase
MDEGNLLSGGLDKLKEIRESLLKLRTCHEKYDKLVLEENKIEKNIYSLEKELSEKVQATTKKRKVEIEEAYDKQLEKTRSRIKRIKEKRDRRKNKKVSERIGEETASLREENHRLKLEGKTLFKQKQVPSFCNTRLYYALYYPRYFVDYIIILASLLITLLVIPCGVYFYILPEEKSLYLIIIYIITVIIFGGLYLLLGNKTKDKYGDVIRQVQAKRHEIIKNNRKIKVIKRKVIKDRDESAYGLEDLDKELSKLNKEIADIAEQKKEALLTFENTTYQVIAAEISRQYDEKISSLKEEYNKISEEIRETDEIIKALTLKIASEYEPFIGKDLMTLDRLASLINIIEAGNASNISEAIQFHRNNMG